MVGYLLFAEVGGKYVDVTSLIFPGKNFFERVSRAVTGVEEIRRKILITGAAGAGLGIVLGIISRKS